MISYPHPYAYVLLPTYALSHPYKLRSIQLTERIGRGFLVIFLVSLREYKYASSPADYKTFSGEEKSKKSNSKNTSP